MIDLEKLRESEGYMLAIVNTKTGEYEPVSEDVMPVIRCKDCVWNREKEWVDCYMSGMHGRNTNNFCSRAQRREE